MRYRKPSSVHITQQKEEFSVAYVHAIAASAGCAVDRPKVDNESVDVEVRSNLSYQKFDNPRIDLQLKCTASLQGHAKGVLKHKIPVHNYNALVSTRRVIPLLLVVVHVPKSVDRWIHQDNRMRADLRFCAYWCAFRGKARSTNSTSVTVSIPRSQVFTPSVIRSWMKRVGDGEFLQ